MSILDLDLSDAQEPQVAPANEEYKLRIVGVKVGVDKNSHDYFIPAFEIPDEPNYKEFSRFYGLPHKDMNPKQLNSCKWQLKSFFEAFKVDHSKKLNVENDLPGKTGWAILGVESVEEYGDKNYIKKLIKPK
ncbi:hypothetical protein LCGC14_2291580 [marine sediment metagenome]|uniref:Uncharacterized protein n=1 Tax=marine sediment metagenome TaxID=412755 RepID=A0A0F9DDR1_9ZZZZ